MGWSLLVDRSGQPIAQDLQESLTATRGVLRRKYPEFLDDCVLDQFLEHCAMQIAADRPRASLQRYTYWFVLRQADRHQRLARGRHTPRGFKGADRLTPFRSDVDPCLVPASYGSAVLMEQRAICAELLAMLTADERVAIQVWLDSGGAGRGNRIDASVRRLGQRARAKLRGLLGVNLSATTD